MQKKKSSTRKRQDTKKTGTLPSAGRKDSVKRTQKKRSHNASVTAGVQRALEKIFILLLKATGVDFSHYRKTTVTRRLRRRLSLSKNKSYGGYLKYLEENPREVELLYDDLLQSVNGEMKAAKEGVESSREKLIALNEKLSERNEELRVHKNFAESIIETAQAIVLVLDTEGRIVRFNQYMEDISGYKLAEVKGKDWFSTFLPKGDHKKFRTVFKKAVSDIQTRGNINPIITKDGKKVLIEWSDKTLKSETGHVIGLLAIGQDITERKKAEEENHLQSEISLNIAEGIYLVGADDGIIRYANPKFEEMFGYNQGEMVGKHVSVVNAPSDKDPAETAKEITGILQKKGEWHGEVYNIKKDGTPFWCYANVSVFNHPAYGRIFISVHTDINERKQAEEAVRESEEKYHLLVENTPSVLWKTSEKGTTVFISSNIKEAYGYAPEEIYTDGYSSWLGRIHHDDLQEVKKSFQALFGKGKKFDVEYRIKRKDGEWIWAHDVANVVHEENGERYAYGVFTDITERKQMQEQLRQKAQDLGERLKELNCLYCISDLVETHDVTLEKIYRDTVNLIPAAWQYPDITCATILMDGREFRTANYRNTRWKQACDIVAGGKKCGSVKVCYLQKKRDLHEGPFLKEERDLINAVAEHLGIIRERFNAEKALQEQMKKNEAVIQGTMNGFWIADIQGNILETNPALQKMLGYTAKELRKMNVQEIEVKEAPEETKKHMRNVRKTGSDFFETRQRCKDGRIIDVEITASMIEQEGHKFFAVFINDITDRKRVQQELEKAQKLESIGTLAAGIAHDFNNMLGGLFGYIDLALERASGDQQLTYYLERAITAHTRAKDLTGQLLTFSKGGGPSKSVVSVPDILLETEHLALSGSNVRCEYTTAKGLRLIEADIGQLSQVFTNILLNSRHAMPDGGTITIKCSNRELKNNQVTDLVEGKYVQIVIKDTGLGIPEEMIPRVFDPFFTTKQMGSGLGLATSYSIIRKHNGHIAINSELGAGTDITILLPATDARLSKKHVKQRPVSKGTGRILIMDDEKMILRATGLLLKSLGYSFECAGNGEEAINLYRISIKEKRKFDAVIFDLTVVSGKGGKEAIKKLLEIDPEAKCIVSSGYSNDPVLAEPEKYGFRGKIAKPYLRKELARVLNEVIRGK